MPNWFKGPAITAEEAQAGKIGEFIQSKAPPPKIADEVHHAANI